MWPYVEQPKEQLARLELVGQAEHSKSCRLMHTGPGSDRQQEVAPVCQLVCNKTKQHFQSAREPLAGYPDPLPILAQAHISMLNKFAKSEVTELTGSKVDKQYLPYWSEKEVEEFQQQVHKGYSYSTFRVSVYL